MIEARNLTSHIYDEEDADMLYQNIITYKNYLHEYRELLASRLFR